VFTSGLPVGRMVTHDFPPSTWPRPTVASSRRTPARSSFRGRALIGQTAFRRPEPAIAPADVERAALRALADPGWRPERTGDESGAAVDRGGYLLASSDER
jgi:hypothetical protein